MSNATITQGSKIAIGNKIGTVEMVYPHGAILVRYVTGKVEYLTKGQLEHGF